MSGVSYRPPILRNILLGIGLCVIVVLVLGAIPQLMKWASLPFMYIPSCMGLTQMVWPADVRAFSLAQAPAVLRFDAPGRYALYTADWDLLVISDEAAVSGRAAWLHLSDPTTGQSLTMSSIKRGLRPYDSPFAPGRPVYTFVVAHPGDYYLSVPFRHAGVAVVPDYVTGRERALALALTAQLAAIILPLTIVFASRHRRRQIGRRTSQQEKRRQADAFWSRQSNRGNRA